MSNPPHLLPSQLLASAEGQRDEYAKSYSELREQYARISSKNQDVDPLVHEELKSKHQDLEKLHQDTLAKATIQFEKLKEKKAEQAKLKAELTDLNQKLRLSHAAEQEAQSKQQQLQQEIQQLQNQFQELKQQLCQLQDKDQHTISQLEKTVENLKKELATAVNVSAPVIAVSDSVVLDGSFGKSKASIPAASTLPTPVTSTANLNPSAPAFGVNSQFPAAASTPAFVHSSTGNADFAADTESSGDKRSSEGDLAGAKQAKRVLCIFRQFFIF